MKRALLVVFICLLTLQVKAQDTVMVVIDTSLGEIRAELYAQQAPITVSNFLRYIDASLFDNSSFYRVCTAENEADRDVKIEVIQGGDVDRSKGYEAIQLETTQTTGLTHENGTLSMARTAALHSATSHFFICVGPQPALDYGGKRSTDEQGFAAFGKVTEGMDTVKQIQSGDNSRQRLKTPIAILSIKRL